MVRGGRLPALSASRRPGGSQALGSGGAPVAGAAPSRPLDRVAVPLDDGGTGAEPDDAAGRCRRGAWLRPRHRRLRAGHPALRRLRGARATVVAAGPAGKLRGLGQDRQGGTPDEGRGQQRGAGRGRCAGRIAPPKGGSARPVRRGGGDAVCVMGRSPRAEHLQVQQHLGRPAELGARRRASSPNPRQHEAGAGQRGADGAVQVVAARAETADPVDPPEQRLDEPRGQPLHLVHGELGLDQRLVHHQHAGEHAVVARGARDRSTSASTRGRRTTSLARPAVAGAGASSCGQRDPVGRRTRRRAGPRPSVASAARPLSRVSSGRRSRAPGTTRAPGRSRPRAGRSSSRRSSPRAP